MIRPITPAALGLLLAAAVAAQNPPSAPDTTCTLPHPRTVDQVDDYHGTQVRDPYRWLEDTDAPDTRAWIAQENCVTFDYLEHIPQRERIRQRLLQLWNYERYGTPSREGSAGSTLYVYSKNDGLQNQSVLYWQPSLEAQPRVLIDPNALSTDGTVALGAWDISRDGRHFAYATAAAGSDWNEFHVREIGHRRARPGILGPAHRPPPDPAQRAPGLVQLHHAALGE